jgi:predicted AlkP superfamily pyrophosphatase or phosphodiesterase
MKCFWVCWRSNCDKSLTVFEVEPQLGYLNRVAVINIVGLARNLVGPETPANTKFAASRALTTIMPAFPAVTCTAQSNYLTGKLPREHGIVANGWYNREAAEVQFWKQSNHLVMAPKIWDVLRAEIPKFTCAQLFWWYNMYSTADYTITPRPMYPADGRKVFDIYTHPFSIRPEIKKDLGEFPFPAFWGPAAGVDKQFKADAVSRWIAESAKWIENKYQPTLSLIYLPHLDYNLQRLGPDHAEISRDLQRIDIIVGDLIQFFEQRGIEPILLSEYGITPVNQPIHPNRRFREKGWIAIKDELGLELLDPGASKVFAVADHQIAHIYINDKSIAPQVANLLRAEPGIDQVLDAPGKSHVGINHSRAGDLVAISKPNAWFTYYYWQDDAKAPDFARCVDIHRKPGYDPVELFVDPQIKFPLLKIATKLMKKKLGFRMLMDVIPLDATLVKGSHGIASTDPQEQPILVTRNHRNPVISTDIFDIIKAAVLKEAT